MSKVVNESIRQDIERRGKKGPLWLDPGVDATYNGVKPNKWDRYSFFNYSIKVDGKTIKAWGKYTPTDHSDKNIIYSVDFPRESEDNLKPTGSFSNGIAGYGVKFLNTNERDIVIIIFSSKSDFLLFREHVLKWNKK